MGVVFEKTNLILIKNDPAFNIVDRVILMPFSYNIHDVGKFGEYYQKCEITYIVRRNPALTLGALLLSLDVLDITIYL